MMIRTRGRRLVSRLEALERIYDTRGPRVFRVIFEYGGEPTIVTIYRDENRTEIIEPPPPDDDPDEFFGAAESTEQHHLEPPLPPDDETTGDPDSEPRALASRVRGDRDEDTLRFRFVGARHAVPTAQPRGSKIPEPRASGREKTGGCPKRRARTRRFINDLREVRGLCLGVFHRPLNARSHVTQRPPNPTGQSRARKSAVNASPNKRPSDVVRRPGNSRHSKTPHRRKTEPRTRVSGQHPGDKRAAVLFTQPRTFLIA